MIPQNDFKRQWQCIEPAAIRAVQRVGESGWYILGEEVEAFEVALAALCGTAFAVGVGNGMDAIELGLRCLNVKPGDKVLTTPFSAFATTLAIIRVGAMPVFVDVDDRGGIDLEQCRRILEHERAIKFLVPVHLYGIPLDLSELARLQREFEVAVIEDCAQAIQASSQGIGVGTIGQASAISFYPTKNLGALGDGGALLTNDGEVATKARALRNYGQSSHNFHDDIGVNSRLDELHAAILRDALLPHVQDWTEARRKTAQRYFDGIRNPRLNLIHPDGEADPVWHLFPILVGDGGRDRLREQLRSADIITGVHYPEIIPQQKALQKYGRYEVSGELSNARQFANCELSLPIHPFLTTDEATAVINACNEWDG